MAQDGIGGAQQRVLDARCHEHGRPGHGHIRFSLSTTTITQWFSSTCAQMLTIGPPTLTSQSAYKLPISVQKAIS